APGPQRNRRGSPRHEAVAPNEDRHALDANGRRARGRGASKRSLGLPDEEIERRGNPPRDSRGSRRAAVLERSVCHLGRRRVRSSGRGTVLGGGSLRDPHQPGARGPPPGRRRTLERRDWRAAQDQPAHGRDPSRQGNPQARPSGTDRPGALCREARPHHGGPWQAAKNRRRAVDGAAANVGVEIRIASMSPDDWNDVRRIYLEGIATGDATFETEAPAWDRWDATHRPGERFVARGDGAVLGWAALSPVSDRCAYGGVAEVSVYVAASARGNGL